MPPRTANSPRFSTSSTREYAAAASAVDDVVQVGASARCAGATGSRSPRPLTCGWSTERTGATTTETGPVSGSSARGCARRRSTARRRPTVSLRGREPLVRQRLPGRVLHDAVRRQQRAQGRGQVLGLAARRRHRQHRAAGLAGERGDGEGAGGRGADQVDVHAVAVGGGLDRFREGGVLDDGVEQTVQAHEGLPSRGWATRSARHVDGPGVSSVRSRPRARGRRRNGPARPGSAHAAAADAPCPGRRTGAEPDRPAAPRRPGLPSRRRRTRARDRPHAGAAPRCPPRSAPGGRIAAGRRAGVALVGGDRVQDVHPARPERRDQGGEQAHEGRADEDRR